ncbi:unnamed protein product [Acanthoscelides obtectus]|uniref:Uncharacterized protein n=1 Tax=Acanthoscelides obtectus TaxID=200917 RepID=A0A9P0PWL3_ACAOB|nr:unnamed protein product [Acanthoscelides obtectus]CAK1668580.1 Laminin subunit alpha-2 [Acanthoscelides obtectus]
MNTDPGPSSSLFQNTDLNVNKSQNEEEEEDLEDQKRRKEELQNLLVAKLDDFNFDESTINSSTNISTASNDDIQHKYKYASTTNEQLQVLYEVRTRELATLREEYEKYKAEKSKEIDNLKNKLILGEAENHQLKISLKNAENLLVEKTTMINDLRKELNVVTNHAKQYEKDIEELQIEISTYQTTLNDLHMKNLTQTPLSNKINAEEIQKIHQEQISKLDTLLKDQTRLSEQYLKEINNLRQELQRLVEIELTDKTAINVLTTNFDSAQKQCEELINIIEVLTNENRHLQERLNGSFHYHQTGTEEKRKSVDNFLDKQLEKMKQMLVDKTAHIDTLNMKLKNYGDCLNELLEYRQLKADALKKEIQECNNQEHTKTLLLLRSELINNEKLLQDKDRQISALNSNNRELLEKMEAMISQTRNDIQNISYKYNIPQLEKMAEDFKKAELRIKELEESLSKSEETRLSLVQKLQMLDKKDLESDIKNMKLHHEKEKTNLENQVKKLQNDLDVASTEVDNLKKYVNELVNDNAKLQLEIKQFEDMRNNEEGHKQIINDLHNLLKDKEQTLKAFEENKKEAEDNLKRAVTKMKKLENTLKEAHSSIADKNSIILELQDKLRRMHEKSQTEEVHVSSIGSELETKLKTLEDDLTEAKTTIIEKDKIIFELQQEIERVSANLRTKMDELVNGDKNNDAETEARLKKLEDALSEANSMIADKDKIIICLQTEIKQFSVNLPPKVEVGGGDGDRNRELDPVDVLTLEFKLREEIQQEYQKNLNEVEKKYKKMAASGRDIQKELSERTKELQEKHKEQLTVVLSECALKIKDLQEEKQDLLEKLEVLQAEFYKVQSEATLKEDTYVKLIKIARKEGEKNAEEWKKWLKQFFMQYMKIETTSKEIRLNILHNMKKADSEVNKFYVQMNMY